MSQKQRTHRFSRIIAAAVGAIGLAALTVPLSSAQAQVPYLGVDFGNGWGVGIGAPPSAYGMAPASPLSPFFGPVYVAPTPSYHHYYYYGW
jgi:hypothetical protein